MPKADFWELKHSLPLAYPLQERLSYMVNILWELLGDIVDFCIFWEEFP